MTVFFRSSARIACLTVIIHAVACGDAEEESEPLALSEEVIDAEAAQQELEGGFILSESERRRSGIYTVVAPSGTCSGTVVSTSAIRQETWVLTAAHCFNSSGDAASLSRNGALIGSGGYTFRHDQYDAGELGVHDVAIVWYPFGVTVETPDGYQMREYYRPIRDAVSPDDVGVFGLGRNQGGGSNDDCDTSGDGSNDGTLRYGEGVAHTNSGGVLVTDFLHPDGTYTHPGDSGGPWMTSFAGEFSTRENYLDHGVILGVHAGRSCIVGNDSFKAAGTHDNTNRSFLLAVAGDSLHLAPAGYTRTCWQEWCEYSDAQRAALIVAATSL